LAHEAIKLELIVAGKVRVANGQDDFPRGDTIRLIRAPEMGADVARFLDAPRALLLKNHGVAVVGGSIEEAVTPATTLKAAAEIQLIVEAAGEPASEFSRDDRESPKQNIARPEQFVTNFNYLTRHLPHAASGAIDSRQVESNPTEFALVAITSLP
jgi:ribulose-5-phosphate 4-epimerase/fuculose-1-phosphate aldolase